MKRNANRWIALLLALGMALGMGAFTVSADADLSNATRFEFSDSGIRVTEGAYDGYKIEGTALTIQGSGSYVVSGSCADGSITVKKGTTGVVLVLDGLELSSSDTAPIACNKGTEVSIVAAAGSVNTLSDSAMNNDETHPENENAENAVLKAKDGSRVTLCGSGTLNIYAYGKNGVKGGASTEESGEASLTIQDLSLNITATVNDGLKSDQELNILSGSVTVSAADDGIKSDYVLNIGAPGTAGPSVTVSQSNEGIEAATLNIYSGTIRVTAADDGMNAANSDLSAYSFSLNIYGGTIYVDAQGDGLDSNGSLNISGGTLEVYSASQGDNQPLDAETAVSITGGTVLAVGAPGMGLSVATGSQAYVVFGSQGMMGGMMGGMGAPGGGQRPGSQNGMQPGGQSGMQPGGQETGGVSIGAGIRLSVLDAEGNSLYTASNATPRAASYVFFSSADLSGGDTNTLRWGENSLTATAAVGTDSAGGTQPGGAPPANGEQPTPPADGERPTPPADGQQPTPPADEELSDGTHTDVSPECWYADAVRWVTEQHLMNGTGNGAFSPEDAASRAMVVTILYRLAGSPAVEYTARFTDVAQGSWYADAVLWAAEQGIVEGYDDGSFRPDDAVTREALAALLYRYAKRLGTAEGGASLTDYTDGDSVSAWAKEAVAWAVDAQILQGYGGSLSPAAGATRAQLAQVLRNYLS